MYTKKIKKIIEYSHLLAKECVLIDFFRHGLARTEYHILHDPKLIFKDVVKNISAKSYHPYLASLPYLRNMAGM